MSPLTDQVHRLPPASFTLSAPANLLLLGEYAITVAGEPGIWLAPECRALAHFETLRPASGKAHLLVRSLWGAEEESHAFHTDKSGQWQADRPGSSSLMATAMEALGPWFAQQGCVPVWESGILTIDTRSFYDAQGTKKGYGSSAVAALLVTASLILSGSRPLALAIRESLARQIPWLAIDIHRRFQGGKGSGYDVGASWHGGMGRFTGGTRPTFLPCDPDEGLHWWVVQGRKEVKTPGAVGHWQTWRNAYPREAEKALEENRALVERWLAARGNHPALEKVLADARDWGLRLGQAIGVDAHIAPGVKALGAGNELGVCLEHGTMGCSDIDVPRDCLNLISLSREGLRLEHHGD